MVANSVVFRVETARAELERLGGSRDCVEMVNRGSAVAAPRIEPSEKRCRQLGARSALPERGERVLVEHSHILTAQPGNIAQKPVTIARYRIGAGPAPEVLSC